MLSQLRITTVNYCHRTLRCHRIFRIFVSAFFFFINFFHNFVSSSVLRSTLALIKRTCSVLKSYKNLGEADRYFLRDKESSRNSMWVHYSCKFRWVWKCQEWGHASWWATNLQEVWYWKCQVLRKSPLQTPSKREQAAKIQFTTYLPDLCPSCFGCGKKLTTLNYTTSI